MMGEFTVASKFNSVAAAWMASVLQREHGATQLIHSCDGLQVHVCKYWRWEMGDGT